MVDKSASWLALVIGRNTSALERRRDSVRLRFNNASNTIRGGMVGSTVYHLNSSKYAAATGSAIDTTSTPKVMLIRNLVLRSLILRS